MPVLETMVRCETETHEQNREIVRLAPQPLIQQGAESTEQWNGAPVQLQDAINLTFQQQGETPIHLQKGQDYYMFLVPKSELQAWQQSFGSSDGGQKGAYARS